jgi:hypothetical protein
MLETVSQKSITPQMLRKFASTARDRMRIEGGGYRRDHFRALAQRVEVDTGEVRIMGSKEQSAPNPRRRSGDWNKAGRSAQLCSEVVRMAGLEPARPFGQQILSL